MTDNDADPSRGRAAEQAAPDSPYHVSRAAVVLIALALGIGLLVGRWSIRTDTSAAPPAPRSTAPRVAPATAVSKTAVPLGPTALAQTGSRCSQQRGGELVLAVNVRNTTAGPIILQGLRVGLPNSGLTLVATGVGACGELNVPNLAGFGLPTGGTVWLSTTVHVAVRCPAPLSVSMVAEVTDTSGAKQAVNVGGFATLRQIPWSGCAAASRRASAR